MLNPPGRCLPDSRKNTQLTIRPNCPIVLRVDWCVWISLLPKQSAYSGATAWQIQQVSGGGSRRRDEGVVTPFGKFPNLSDSSCLSFFFFLITKIIPYWCFFTCNPSPLWKKSWIRLWMYTSMMQTNPPLARISKVRRDYLLWDHC